MGAHAEDGRGGLTAWITGAAETVHRHFGPGLLPCAYEAALDAELRYLGLRVERGIGLPIEYRDARLEHGYRIGMLVERKVIVECLALGHVAPVDTSRLLTYLRLMDLDVGLLFNFNTRSFAAGGIHRVHRPRPCPGAEHPPTTGANGRKASLPGYSSVNR